MDLGMILVRTPWTHFFFSSLHLHPFFSDVKFTLDTVCTEVTHSIFWSIPPAHQKQPISHSDKTQIRASHNPLFFTRNAKRRTHCLTKRILLPSRNLVTAPTGLWNRNLESMVRSLWFGWTLIAKSFISIQPRNWLSIFPRRFALIDSSFYQGALSSWKTLSLQFPLSGPGWPPHTNVQILSFFQMIDLLTICTAFQAFFSFF